MVESGKRLGLYLHIPFCVRKCKYCDFLSAPATKAAREAYVKAMMREIKEKGRNRFGDASYSVKTIYIGGGTPSLLEAEEMEGLVTKCKEAFHIRDGQLSEFTIEVNPGTADVEKWKAYRRIGVSRISFGLQSVHNEELELLGRIHRYEDFVENYQLAREVGFTNISVDIMAGLPNQTMEWFRESLHTVCGLQPEHISVYSLAIEPGTEFYKMYGETHPMEEDMQIRMYQAAKETMENHGYHQYEISNYAKKGYEAIHNQSYWERVDYLGLGLGASSLLDNVRYQNEADMGRYLDMAKEAFFMEKQELSHKEQMEEFMFLGLRMTRGVGEAEFYRTFGESLDDVYGDVLEKWETDAYLIRKDGRIRLSDKGFLVSNRVLADFLQSG